MEMNRIGLRNDRGARSCFHTSFYIAYETMFGPIPPDFGYWNGYADVYYVINLDELSAAYSYP